MASKKPDVLVGDGDVYVLRAGTKVYVKTADICAMTKKSNQWIGQLTSQGVIAKKSTPHGSMYEVAPTVSAYIASIDDRISAKQDQSSEKLEKEKLEAETSIKKAKAITEVLNAKELQGKMHRSEDVEAMTTDLIYAVRGMLLALPGRLAVDVAAAESSPEAAEIVRSEVHKVMDEIANYRYDPKKYEERVRERRSWDSNLDGDD